MTKNGMTAKFFLCFHAADIQKHYRDLQQPKMGVRRQFMPGELKGDVCGKEVGDTKLGYKPYWYYNGQSVMKNPRVCRDCWAKHCSSELFVDIDI